MRPGVETGGRGQEALWLPATAFLLLMAAGLLVFTSPPGAVAPSPTDNKARKLPRRSRPKNRPDPIAVGVVEDDESHREPLWLLAFSSVVVIGVGMLLIFYTDLPISALV